MMSSQDFHEKQILFLVAKDGEKLSFRNDNVIVTDKNGNIKHQSTCYRLFAIIVVGHISITTGLIQRAKKFGFGLVFMTAGFRMYQSISSTAQANVMLRKKQYQYSSTKAAKALIENKILNQRRLLASKRDKSEYDKNAIAKLDGYISKLSEANEIRAIMGIEGSASRVYFASWFDNIAWTGRKPRIKQNMVNALLDIGYTILFAYIEALVALYGFDEYCGILHTQFYMRKSLVCDLVEPFRVIIDRQTKKSINLGQFKEKDFEIYGEKWCLKYKKSAEYSSIFLSAIMKHKDEMFVYVRDFYRAFMKERLDLNFPKWELE